MKKKIKIISVLLSGLFIFYGLMLVFPSTAVAATCSFSCQKAGVTAADHCSDRKSNGGYLYAEPTSPTNSDCNPATAPSCTSNQTQICCCETNAVKIFPKAPVSTPTAVEPKYEIPDMQIEIPGLSFGDVQCVNQPNGSFLCSVSWIGDYISAVYRYGLSVGGILAAIMLMAGGVLWLVSGGDASRVGQAKDLISGSVVGLIILFSAYLVLYQINPEITKLNPIKIASITIGDTLNTSDFIFDSNDIKNQADDASPELAKFLNCMHFNLPEGMGRISSISDSNHIGDLIACGKAGCSNCTHTCGSCHYGGGLATNKSYAVDFGDETNDVQLRKAAAACGAAFILNEGNHLHMSVNPCPAK
jgi:hypothetical protein